MPDVDPLGTESPFGACASCGTLVLFRVWMSAGGSTPAYWRVVDQLASPVCGVPHVCMVKETDTA